MIIAIGITALVGILTALDAITNKLGDDLSSMGSNTFSIEPYGAGLRSDNDGKKIKYEAITFEQALEFKRRFEYPATVSVSYPCSSFGTVRFEDEKSNPNVSIYGGDENYVQVGGYEVEYGRNFTELEASNGRNVAVIGTDIVKLLFGGEKEKALDQLIFVGSIRYKVIGVLKEKGSSMSQASDRMVLIPLYNASRFYDSGQYTYNLQVGVKDAVNMESAISEATGVFRNIRKLKISEPSNFEMTKSDGLLDLFLENTVYIRWATILIGLITLLGAAIGLMNIMLVSVTERTREIGISKALGATKNNILIQFLSEAVVITQIGGILGVIFGIVIGNLVAVLIKGSFVAPIGWMALGLVMCFFTGLLSGIYPAYKAAGLDPIESLRYE